MSETQTTPGPRRSQRDKKPVKQFSSIDTASSKRKRDGSDAGGSSPEASDADDAPGDDEEEAEEEAEENVARTPKPKTASKGKAKAAPKARGPPPAKKPRVTKVPGPKAAKTTARKGRQAKGDDGAFSAAKVAKDTKISDDNPLFNAIMNPSAALQSTAEDFLESLDQNPGSAQAELINLVLRACGCNDSINADEVLDYDGVVDALDNFTEGLKQDDSPVYPLTSKLPAFKKFRKSLSEFIERLVASSADLESLYTSDLMATLQTWVIAMSSSQIRSFRHTATVVALEVETALCDVAAAVEKEAEVVGRQKEGEKKRKATNKSGGVRDQELNAKAEEVRVRRNTLAEYLKEFVDGVFVHRYRDLDPNIRAECVRAIGFWFTKYPGHFLDASYLRYVGWVLSDSNTHVRLEAVRALSGVYDQRDYIGSLNHFTERFKPRLIEMAQGDTELSVRVAVIHVLGVIDDNALLEDEEREKLCLLVFDEEAKVRRAVSGFVQGVWKDAVDERLVGRKPTKQDKARAGIKTLGTLLVQWGKDLDQRNRAQGALGVQDEDGSSVDDGNSLNRKEVAALVADGLKGRIALAVEALWDEVEPVSDWEELLDMLLLDHSAAGESNTQGARGRRANGKGAADDSAVDETWRLEETEESVLLEVLVSALKLAKAEAAGGKKGEEETVTNNITRELIKGLQRLFIKHQTDSTRIAQVLLIPPLMNLDLYLEMRMITAYASLWDIVTKQFLSHSSLNVLMHAVAAIRHFLDATSLANTNSTKILDLEDELSSLLRDAVAGRDEIEVASFTEDEVVVLGTLCARLTVLAGMRNIAAWIEEDEGGKQSSAWDIISALVERGRLGYKEEEMMVDQAIHLLTLHIMWKLQGLAHDAEPSAEEIRFREKLQEQRDFLLEKLIEYAVGTQSNTVEGVKRAAFQNLIHLYILFCPAQSLAADGGPLPTAALALTLDDEVQYRCAGFIQAEIERYVDEFDDSPRGGNDDGSNEDDSSDEENENEDVATNARKAKGGKGRRKEKNDVIQSSRTRLEREYMFMNVIYAFVRAIRAGAIHPRHCSTLLAHHGRLGPAFDSCSKAVVEVLREEGMNNGNGELVVTVITQALQESFTLVLDNIVSDESRCVALSKLLFSCLVVRGAQLAIIGRLDSKFVVEIHTKLLTWLGKRLAIYENNKNKKSRRIAISFFKVLLPLLHVIQSRDALKIKAHLDQVLAQAKVEILPMSKIWEPQRAYEKRLATAMAKDKAPGTKGRKAKSKSTKSVAAVSSGEDTDGDGMVDEDLPEVPPPMPSRPRPRRITRSAREYPVADIESDAADPDPATPKARSRQEAEGKSAQNFTSKSPPETLETPKGSPARSATVSDSEPNAAAPLPSPAPTSSRKRARPEEELSHENTEDISGGTTLPHEDAPSSADEPVMTTPIFRRKRIRH